MAKNTYDRGDKVRLKATVRDSAGALVDPTSIVLRVRDPGQALGSPTLYSGGSIVKDSVGLYHCDVDVNLAGTWRYRWESTGGAIAAEEGEFEVRASGVIS